MLDKPIPTCVEMSDYMIHIMRGLNAQLFKEIGNRVVCGPFAGMTVNPDPHWCDGNASTKLLGCYEFELLESIAQAVHKIPKTIVNVGCAEGYYAIGFARLLPDATVFAMDTDQESLKECREAAIENEVADRVRIVQGCNCAAELEVDAPVDGRFYFIDCEGHEFELLDVTECPSLSTSDLIIECHEFLRPGITEMLAERFKSTHEMRVIRPKLPPLDRYPFLAETPSVMNLLAVTEKRPMPTRWLACWAH